MLSQTSAQPLGDAAPKGQRHGGVEAPRLRREDFQKKNNPKPPTNRGLFSVTAWKRRAPSPLVLGFSLMSKIWRGVGILPGMHTLRTTALQNCLKTIASAGVGANLNSQFCP